MRAAALQPFVRPRLWLALWIAALIATLVLGLLPMPPLALEVDDADKALHWLGHAALAAYAVMLFRARPALIAALFGLFAFGTVIELLQTLLPWRSGGDLADMLANALGTACGALLRATPLRRGLQWLDALTAPGARPG